MASDTAAETSQPEGPSVEPPAEEAEEGSRFPHPTVWLRIREDVPGWLKWLLGVLPILAILGIFTFGCPASFFIHIIVHGNHNRGGHII